MLAGVRSIETSLEMQPVGERADHDIDVVALEPSEFLTAEEIAAAEAAQYPGDVLNPQTQTQVTWPADLVAAAEASRKGG